MIPLFARVLLLVGALSATACGTGNDPGNPCKPGAAVSCVDGVSFWIDSCGDRGETQGECSCGCNAEGTGCASCECIPSCDARECGPDGCEGSCAPGCSVDEECNPQGLCICPAGTRRCSKGSECQDVSNDLQNCGDCGAVCEPGLECRGGSCLMAYTPPGVGDPCTKHEDCGQNGYCLSPEQGFPQGYCLTLNCSKDAPCVAGTDCFELFSDGTTACIKHCTSNTDCRFDEGYICDQQYAVCWPGCLTDEDCPTWYDCDLSTHECVEEPPCTDNSCPEGLVCAGGHCVVDAGPGPGLNTSFPLDQLGSLCPELQAFECPENTEAACGPIVPFDPDYGPGYIDYPENGESWDNQYRSFLRRDLMLLIKHATSYVSCLANDWTVGNGQPLGLIDMSEANGAIPGTSTGSPGHPAGTHTNGFDIDVAYYQVGTQDNRARAICDHHENGKEAYHCTKPPHLLDPWRSALFLGALLAHPEVRVVGCDGKVGPILVSALAQLCADHWLSKAACNKVDKLAYEETDQGYGWFYFHHHHMHVSFSRPPYGTRSANGGGKDVCLIPGCPPEPLEQFLVKKGIHAGNP